MINQGPEPKTDENEDTDNDADEAGWDPDSAIERWFRFNWQRVEADPRFMYQSASWRRMLPLQPITMTIWNMFRTRSGPYHDKCMRSIREREVVGRNI